MLNRLVVGFIVVLLRYLDRGLLFDCGCGVSVSGLISRFLAGLLFLLLDYRCGWCCWFEWWLLVVYCGGFGVAAWFCVGGWGG